MTASKDREPAAPGLLFCLVAVIAGLLCAVDCANFVWQTQHPGSAPAYSWLARTVLRTFDALTAR
jgi:hypothetical protein